MAAVDLTGDGGVTKKILRSAKPDALQPSDAAPIADGELHGSVYHLISVCVLYISSHKLTLKVAQLVGMHPSPVLARAFFAESTFPCSRPAFHFACQKTISKSTTRVDYSPMARCLTAREWMELSSPSRLDKEKSFALGTLQ